MKFKLLVAVACCLVALPFILHAQPKSEGCGRPFTARAFGAGMGKQGAELACQGPIVRVVRADSQGMMLADTRGTGKLTMVFDATRDYCDPPLDAKDDRFAFAPCRELARVKRDFPDATCRKAGSETVNGRRTDKYVIKGEEGDDEIVEYFDPELGVPIKVVKGDRVDSELKDIRLGTPAGPMAVPAGYRKLSEKEYVQRAVEAAKKGAARKAG
jgi:hypothetical protein